MGAHVFDMAAKRGGGVTVDSDFPIVARSARRLRAQVVEISQAGLRGVIRAGHFGNRRRRLVSGKHGIRLNGGRAQGADSGSEGSAERFRKSRGRFGRLGHEHFGASGRIPIGSEVQAGGTRGRVGRSGRRRELRRVAVRAPGRRRVCAGGLSERRSELLANQSPGFPLRVENAQGVVQLSFVVRHPALGKAAENEQIDRAQSFGDIRISLDIKRTKNFGDDILGSGQRFEADIEFRLLPSLFRAVNIFDRRLDQQELELLGSRRMDFRLEVIFLCRLSLLHYRNGKTDRGRPVRPIEGGKLPRISKRPYQNALVSRPL